MASRIPNHYRWIGPTHNQAKDCAVWLFDEPAGTSGASSVIDSARTATLPVASPDNPAVTGNHLTPTLGGAGTIVFGVTGKNPIAGGTDRMVYFDGTSGNKLQCVTTNITFASNTAWEFEIAAAHDLDVSLGVAEGAIFTCLANENFGVGADDYRGLRIVFRRTGAGEVRVRVQLIHDLDSGAYIQAEADTPLARGTVYRIRVYYDGSQTSAGLFIRINDAAPAVLSQTTGGAWAASAKTTTGGTIRFGVDAATGSRLVGWLGPCRVQKRNLTATSRSRIETFLTNAADAALDPVGMGELHGLFATGLLHAICLGDSKDKGSAAAGSVFDCFGERLDAWNLATRAGEFKDPRALSINTTAFPSINGTWAQGDPTTITSAGHGLNTADLWYLESSDGTGSTGLETGWYSVTRVDANTFTIDVDTTGGAGGNVTGRQLSAEYYGVSGRRELAKTGSAQAAAFGTSPTTADLPSPFDYSMGPAFGYPFALIRFGKSVADDTLVVTVGDTYGNQMGGDIWTKCRVESTFRDGTAGVLASAVVSATKSGLSAQTGTFTSTAADQPHNIADTIQFATNATATNLVITIRTATGTTEVGKYLCITGFWVLAMSPSDVTLTSGFFRGVSISEDGWRLGIQHADNTYYDLQNFTGPAESVLPSVIRTPNMLIVRAGVNDLDPGGVSASDVCDDLYAAIDRVMGDISSIEYVLILGVEMSRDSGEDISYTLMRALNVAVRNECIARNTGLRFKKWYWFSFAEAMDYAVPEQLLRDGVHYIIDDTIHDTYGVTTKPYPRQYGLDLFMSAVSSATPVYPLADSSSGTRSRVRARTR